MVSLARLVVNCHGLHPKRCTLYMRWGDRDSRGCSGTTCGKVHPTLCPKSLDLRCFDKFCQWKLHTQRCQRATAAAGGWQSVNNSRERGGGQQGQDRGGYGREQYRGGFGTRGGDQGPNQYYQNRGEPDRRGPGGNNTQYRSGRGFQGMTAQQEVLGAFNLTGFEQQLQEAVTRAIVMAMSATRGQGVPAGLRAAAHSQ